MEGGKKPSLSPSHIHGFFWNPVRVVWEYGSSPCLNKSTFRHGVKLSPFSTDNAWCWCWFQSLFHNARSDAQQNPFGSCVKMLLGVNQEPSPWQQLRLFSWPALKIRHNQTPAAYVTNTVEDLRTEILQPWIPHVIKHQMNLVSMMNMHSKPKVDGY